MARYGPAARALHWLIAILFLAATGLALFRETFEPHGVAMISAHKIVGLIMLALVVGRLAIASRRPPPAGRGWERLLAKSVHRTMLALLVLVPLAGWTFVSLAPDNRPLDYRGGDSVPRLPLCRDDSASFAWHEVHELAGFALIALFAVHLAAVLYHQLRPGDRVFSRMTGPGQAWLVRLAFAVLVLWAAGLTLDFLNVRLWS